MDKADSRQSRIDSYLEIIKKYPSQFKENRYLKIITDPLKMMAFENANNCILGLVYQSEYHMMVADLVEDLNGNVFRYERLIAVSPDNAVVIVPIINNKFVLLHQFRHAIRDMEYSFPRGFGELKMKPEDNARKELKEELGADATRIEFVGQIVANSGICGDHVNVYAAEINHAVLEKGYEGIKEIEYLTEADLKQWIKDKKILDAFTLSAFMLYLETKS